MSTRTTPLLLLALLPLLDPGGACGQEPQRASFEVRRDVVYGEVAGERLRLDVAVPASSATPRPLLLLLHGGGWAGGERTSLEGWMRRQAARGYVAATVSYRLSQRAVFPAQIEDCKCAVRYFRAHAGEYGLDPARVGALGFSAGGHLAALLGTAGGAKELEGSGGWGEHSSRVQAVCSVFGPTDLTRFPPAEEGPARGAHDLITRLLGGTPAARPEAARAASPLSWASAESPPFLFVHGDRDRLVPLEQSELLAAALRAAGVEAELRVVQGAAHGGKEFEEPALRQAIEAFLDRHLRSGAPGR